MIGCHDGKIVAYTDRYGPDARLADTMPEKAAATLSEGARPLVRSDRGRHHGWPGWPELMERFGLAGLTGAKGCSPGNAAAEGFFGGMRAGSVYPERWEERTRGKVLALIDECIHWFNYDRVKQSRSRRPPGALTNHDQGGMEPRTVRACRHDHNASDRQSSGNPISVAGISG